MSKLTKEQLEQKRIDNKKYYQKNKIKIKEKHKKYYQKNKDEGKEYYKEYSKRYQLKNRERIKEYSRNHQRDIRRKLVKLMGGKCLKCGFSDYRALQIDHINGGGYYERKKALSKNFNRRAIRSVEAGEKKFQLLCANCNWIKRWKNNETRLGKNNKRTMI